MSSNLPKNLRYTKEHEWLQIEADGSILVGITEHAVDQLGEITMVSLPAVGAKLSAGQSFGDIDSVKAVSELYAPVDGSVIAINESLSDAPEQVNEEPYGKGWMIRVKASDASQLDSLLDAASYEKYLADLS
jgi:glycine cleavage system H protein